MDIYEVIYTRRSIRKYRPEPVPEEALRRVLDAAGRAPWGDGGSKRPPTRFIVVRAPETRGKLVPLCHNQSFIGSAPVVIVVCIPETKGYNRGGWMQRYSSLVDASIALDHLILAARAEGLGTCWIGSFDNAGMKAFFGLSEDINVAAPFS
jgi:nitroreductase